MSDEIGPPLSREPVGIGVTGSLSDGGRLNLLFWTRSIQASFESLLLPSVCVTQGEQKHHKTRTPDMVPSCGSSSVPESFHQRSLGAFGFETRPGACDLDLEP